jgi:MFS family permease
MRQDPALICAAGFLRATAVSLVGVLIALHFARLGLSASAIGLILGAGLAGSSAATLIVTLRGDAWGRRRTLVVITLLTGFGYLAVAVSSTFLAFVPFAFIGLLNGMGRDRGPASVLDQAILAATVDAGRRTWALAWYNVSLDAGHALGALAAATPTLLARSGRLGTADPHRVIFMSCAAAALATMLPYSMLSGRVETASPAAPRQKIEIDPRSRRVVGRLALLFGLDSVGGGFLNSALIAYWFFRQYGMSETNLALLFFTARGLNAVSPLGAAWLARRIGLLNTMVWTHLPSSLLLMIAPAAPTAAVAAALFLAREGLVEMDVPTRQSYVLAVVRPHERTFASGVTNLTRNVAWAVGPTLAGTVMQYVALAGPLLIGGSLKIVYDLLLYASFRHLHPPEETAGEPGRAHVRT